MQNIIKREREVLNLIAYEYTMQEIASSLNLSHHIVVSHRKNIIAKLNDSNSAGLIRRAFELGLFTVNPLKNLQTNKVVDITLAA